MKDVIAFDEMTYQYDEDYKLFLEGIKYSFNNAVKMGHNHLFTTDANGLYDTFLDCLPAEFRQIYNCNACRHFVNKFGGLVVIDENTGEQTPAMWITKPRCVSAIRLKGPRLQVYSSHPTKRSVHRQLGAGYTWQQAFPTQQFTAAVSRRPIRS